MSKVNLAIPELEINVRVGDQIVKRKLSDDLAVDEEHINDTLLRAPGITAYWASLYERQRGITQRKKVELERLRAQKDKHYRTLAKRGSDRVSNAEIAAMIQTDEEYTAVEDEYLQLHETELILKAALEAIKELRSTLISLSANMRTERQIKQKGGAEEEYLRRRRDR